MSKQHNEEELSSVVSELISSYQIHGGINHLEGFILPSQDTVKDIIETLLNILFPGFFAKEEITQDMLKEYTATKVKSLHEILIVEFTKALNLQNEFKCLSKELKSEKLKQRAQELSLIFLKKISTIRNVLQTDVEAFFEGDPAAKSQEEIIVSYPGLYAIAVYRTAHELFLLNVPLIPRIMTEYAHSKTGIDIHPGATIDQYFFIDHGTGVVIGETTVIGKRCRIYQGVTLGATKILFERDKDGNIIESKKRHPTLEDDVIIYAGATILGGNTILKKGTVIGANAWVTTTTDEGDKVIYETGNNQRVVKS